jgi:hypothetical protein
MARSKRRRVSHCIAPLTASSWENKNKRGLHGRARAFPHGAPAGIYMVDCLITGHGMAWHGMVEQPGCDVGRKPRLPSHPMVVVSLCVCRRASFPCSMDITGTHTHRERGREGGREKSPHRILVIGEKGRCDDQKAIYIYIYIYVSIYIPG